LECFLLTVETIPRRTRCLSTTLKRCSQVSWYCIRKNGNCLSAKHWQL
jgi:hypothetical protein